MAGTKHLQKSKLLEGVDKSALCRCGKSLLSLTPERCPLHGVLPSEGTGMCRCCTACRNKCFDEV